MKKYSIALFLFLVLTCLYIFKINEKKIKNYIKYYGNNKNETIIQGNSEKNISKIQYYIYNESLTLNENVYINQKVYEENKVGNFPSFIYHRCVNNRIPRVSGMLETAEYLRYTNKSLIRFGDDDIHLIMMVSSPKEQARQNLSDSLMNAFNNNNSDVVVGIPNILSDFLSENDENYFFWSQRPHLREWIEKNAKRNKQYFDTHISSPFTSTYGTHCELLDEVYNNLREIWRDKDLVILRGNNGEVYDYDVYDTAKSQKILFAPSTKAWLHYEELKSTLLKEDKSKLFILAIGPTSKILVMDMVKDGRRALDLGHLAKDYNCFKHNKFDNRFFFDDI